MFDFTDFLAAMAIEDAHEECEREDEERNSYWSSDDDERDSDEEGEDSSDW